MSYSFGISVRVFFFSKVTVPDFESTRLSESIYLGVLDESRFFETFLEMGLRAFESSDLRVKLLVLRVPLFRGVCTDFYACIASDWLFVLSLICNSLFEPNF